MQSLPELVKDFVDRGMCNPIDMAYLRLLGMHLANQKPALWEGFTLTKQQRFTIGPNALQWPTS